MEKEKDVKDTERSVGGGETEVVLERRFLNKSCHYCHVFIYHLHNPHIVVWSTAWCPPDIACLLATRLNTYPLLKLITHKGEKDAISSVLSIWLNQPQKRENKSI